MERLIIDGERCKNCFYCINHCPHKALSVNRSEVNSMGYNPIVVDHEKCVTCGICYLVCPDYVFEIREVDSND